MKKERSSLSFKGHFLNIIFSLSNIRVKTNIPSAVNTILDTHVTATPTESGVSENTSFMQSELLYIGIA